MISEPYKRLAEDQESIPGANSGAQNPPQQPAGPRVFVSNPTNATPTKLYAPRTMKLLAFSQLGLAILIFFFTVICFGVTLSHRRLMAPVDGTGIWNGILAIIAGSFGVAATVRGRYSNRCVMVTYFVLSIIVTVFMGFLVFMSGIWSTVAGTHLSGYNRYKDRLADWEERQRLRKSGRLTTTTSGYDVFPYGRPYDGDKPYNYYGDPELIRAALGLHLTIGLMAFGHMVSTIVSLALVCYNWNKTGCCGVQSNGNYPNVVYIAGNHQQQQHQQLVMVPLVTWQQHEGQPLPLASATGTPQTNSGSASDHSPPPAYDHLLPQNVANRKY